MFSNEYKRSSWASCWLPSTQAGSIDRTIYNIAGSIDRTIYNIAGIIDRTIYNI